MMWMSRDRSPRHFQGVGVVRPDPNVPPPSESRPFRALGPWPARPNHSASLLRSPPEADGRVWRQRWFFYTRRDVSRNPTTIARRRSRDPEIVPGLDPMVATSLPCRHSETTVADLRTRQSPSSSSRSELWIGDRRDQAHAHPTSHSQPQEGQWRSRPACGSVRRNLPAMVAQVEMPGVSLRCRTRTTD